MTNVELAKAVNKVVMFPIVYRTVSNIIATHVPQRTPLERIATITAGVVAASMIYDAAVNHVDSKIDIINDFYMKPVDK